MTFAPTPDTNWLEHTACRGSVPVALFFTPKRGPVDDTYDEAVVAACNRCPAWVRDACLDDALAVPADLDQGYRAGLTRNARLKVRRRRALDARRAS